MTIKLYDENSYLTGITERTRIEKLPDGPAYTEDGETWHPLATDTVVSMNMWGFQKPVLDTAKELFAKFLTDTVPQNPMKAEFYLPAIPSHLMAEGTGTVQVLKAGAKWYGVTYREDLPGVVAAIEAMKADGKYPAELWT